MATNKTIALRISDENRAKLEELAQKFENKDELIGAMLNAITLSESIERNKNRKTEIETFQLTINRLTEMFINSLNVNEASEEKLSRKYETRISELNDIVARLEQNIGDLNEENKILSQENHKMKNETSTIKSLESILSMYALPSNMYEKTLKKIKEDLGGFVCFKEYRDDFIDAVDTIRYFRTVEELKTYASSICKKRYIDDKYEPEISFSTNIIYDNRIGWNVVDVLNHEKVIGQADISSYV